jgi:acetyl-CoA carboxylase biotin carboxyl carrier protein
MTEDGVSPHLTATEVVDAVRALADIMAKGGITEVDVTLGDAAIRLRGDGRPITASAIDATLGSTGDNVASHGEREAFITAPMIGTFYSSASPNDPPFVGVGDHVDVGQTVGIIEAMKIMNEIAATHAGTVQAILVENAQPVEYGSPLIRLTPPLEMLP